MTVVASNTLRWAFIGLLLAVAAEAVSAQAVRHVQQTYTTQVQYASGTAEHAQIRAWLEQNAVGHTGVVLGQFDKLGAFTVVTSMSANRNAVVMSAPYPPAPLPSGGNEGDTFTVSSCASGVSQSWSYVRQGGQWRLKSYSVEYSTQCEPS